MEKKILFLIAILIIMFIPDCFALTANSSSYSVSMFGNGLAASTPSSTNYNSTALSEAKGTTRNAESGTYTANIGFFEDTSYYKTVSITSYSISPRTAVVGSTISLSISALNSQSVWARIIAPNSQTQILNLVNDAPVNYLPSPSVIGRYNVTFYANSSTGAIASAVDYFELTAQTTTPPSTGSNGGGGSTTIIEKSCTYNWDCTPWSLCVEGKQKRECKNTGTCNGTESKPIEEMQCSMALFDIALNLKDIKLTENNTLKFNISLTEKIGIEKLDVYIKYSIIDKEGNEIFSQIETKAIQGNLSYKKEINDIKLKDGEYILRVDILYGNLQRASAEQKFKIGDWEIKEKSTSNIKKSIEIINKIDYKVILAVILAVISSLFIFKRRSHQISFVYVFLGLLIVALLITTVGLNVTGEVINNLSSYEWKRMLPAFVIILFILLLIILREKFTSSYKKITELLSRVNNKHKKYPLNSVIGLINKKVYAESGIYIGKIKEIVLGKNKIDSLKIRLDKKQRFEIKGIAINYRYIVGVKEIMIVDDKVLDEINKKSPYYES